ncbi:D-alanyl-D-alanine carboxypeptidase [Ligilactobacillus equi]|uniref:D-alanyl-D-alanine carboxypeptidase family protein n=1 Tax=Ligilactobacillus equi TaxID=137357 RepID=UPI002ED0E9C5
MRLFKEIKKMVVSLLTVTALLTPGLTVFTTNQIQAQAATLADSQESLNLTARAAIAVDAKTGQVLYAKNAETTMPVASMSKLLTAYLVLEAIHDHKLTWNQEIPVDKDSAAVSQDTSLSNVPLKTDHQYTVKSLYQAMLIYSANGATMALGYALAGSHPAFIDLMRKQARKFGIQDAQLYTANGLSNGEVKGAAYPGVAKNAENAMSAKDMALIGQNLLQKYPEILKTTAMTKAEFDNGTNKTQMENWNWMLKGLSKAYTKLPVDGLKTGTSDSAGACFIGTVNKDGHRIITVVMGSRHEGETDTARFEDSQKLMSYVYNNYTYTNLAQGQSYAQAKSLATFHGKELTVPVQTAQASHLWLQKGLTKKQIQASVMANKKLTEKNGLVAPIAQGKTVGNYDLTVKGQKLAFLNGQTSLQIPAQTKQAVQKANIFVVGWRTLMSKL